MDHSGRFAGQNINLTLENRGYLLVLMKEDHGGFQRLGD
jgi:hypothetical protein